MLAKISQVVKSRAPRVHELLKRSWRSARLPLPKMLMGELIWIDSRLLGAEMTEPHVLQWIRSSLKTGDTFFDVGAHQGWMSLVAAKRVGRRGRVVVFEPSPPLVEVLRYHQRVNRLRQMEIVDKGVSDNPGVGIPFHLVEGGNSYLNALADTAGPSAAKERISAIEIETVTLDDFCRHSGCKPAVIKIDVEGAELMVLHGAAALLEECRPALIVAVHPSWMPQGQRAEDLFEFLGKLGYRVADSKVVRYEGSDFGDYLCVAG